MPELIPHSVWDRGTRLFHWINVLCVLGLSAVGLVILNAGALDISDAGKILLKTIHVWIGYAFALNLFWRLAWGFLGNRYARWGAILPFRKGYASALGAYLRGVRAGEPPAYRGHNPLGRLSVTVLLLVLLIQAITGLVLAGTDIFYPPLGHWIAQWIAAPGTDPAALVPYAKEMYEPAAYEAMRAFRGPFVTVHLYNFYLLASLIVLHIAAVVVMEVRYGENVISAMFSGRKVLTGPPADE